MTPLSAELRKGFCSEEIGARMNIAKLTTAFNILDDTCLYSDDLPRYFSAFLILISSAFAKDLSSSIVIFLAASRFCSCRLALSAYKHQQSE